MRHFQLILKLSLLSILFGSLTSSPVMAQYESLPPLQDPNNQSRGKEEFSYNMWMSLKETCLRGDGAVCIQMRAYQRDLASNPPNWMLCADGPNRVQCIRGYVGKSYRGLP